MPDAHFVHAGRARRVHRGAHTRRQGALSDPRGHATGTTFRLRGKGIPYVGYKTRGDQFVTVVVETPTKLTREQKELLKQLESSVGDDGQPKRKSFFDKLKG